MMMNLGCKLLSHFSGKTLATAESLTGGGIGAAITAVPGSSAFYKGGVISYTNEIKENILGVTGQILKSSGAVSAPVAEAMAYGARKLLNTDAAVSVTGLAGPAGDEYGNPVGTVFIGYSDRNFTLSRHFLFSGDREAIRQQTIEQALQILLDHQP